MVNSCNPMGYSLPSPTVHEIFRAKILEWSWHLVLQGIFPTQGLNLGLLHCRRILCCLSQLGSLEPEARINKCVCSASGQALPKLPYQKWSANSHCINSDKFKFPPFHTDTFLVKLGHQFILLCCLQAGI